MMKFSFLVVVAVGFTGKQRANTISHAYCCRCCSFSSFLSSQSNTIASWLLLCFAARFFFALFSFAGDAVRFLFAEDGFAWNKGTRCGGGGDCCDSNISKSITLFFVATSSFLLASAASHSLFARLSAFILPAFGFGFSADDAKSITIGSPGFSLFFLLLFLLFIICRCGSFLRKSSNDAFIAASLSRWYLASKSRTLAILSSVFNSAAPFHRFFQLLLSLLL